MAASASATGSSTPPAAPWGKGNLEKTPYGKLAVTLIERASNKAIRVSYKPTLQKRIAESAFMIKRGQGIEPDEIPEAEQLELVNLSRRHLSRTC